MDSKFKYLLGPDNVYILDFGDFQAQIRGQEIMDRLYREFYLVRIQEQLNNIEEAPDGNKD